MMLVYCICDFGISTPCLTGLKSGGIANGNALVSFRTGEPPGDKKIGVCRDGQGWLSQAIRNLGSQAHGQ